MADTVEPETRSRIMARVGQRDTPPELAVRRILHAAGYRFRTHRRDLPGTPDIVLPKYRAVINVHGCFWHQHPGCRRSRRPTSNVDYWNSKLDANVVNDERNMAALALEGWKVMTVWECESEQASLILTRLKALIGGNAPPTT